MIRNGCKRCVSVEVKGPDQLEHALRSLKRKLKKENFYVVKTIEIIERQWEIDGRKVRPKGQEIGHSGFLTFMRKIK